MKQYGKQTMLLLILGSILSLACFAGEALLGKESDPPANTMESELDQALHDFMKTYKIPGLAVGLVKENQVVYAKGFGFADPEKKVPITTRSLFHLASVSKVFVTTAVMQLVEEKKVDLDAPVIKYLPYFQLDHDGMEKITLRLMLTHASGMPDVSDYHWDKPEKDDMALERYVRSLKDHELIAAPGQKWSYSNMAFEVLGDMIAKVRGQTFEEAMEAMILEPLEMKQSTYLLEDVDPALRTTPYIGRREPEISPDYPYHRAHAPSSTLHSNVAEMCNWIVANLNRGQFKKGRILEEASYDLMWKSYLELRKGRDMGLGWFLADTPLGPRIFHGGRDMGFRASLVLLPEKSAGLVMLSNYSETPMPLIRDSLLKIAFPDGD